MKSSLKNYKEYPFPIRFLLAYLAVSIVGVILLDMFAMWLITEDAMSGFFDMILSVLIILLVFIVGMAILCWILMLLCAGGKIYRGIGLYHFMTVIAILCPILFIGMIIYLQVADMTYTFFNFVTLFLECCVPVCIMICLRLLTHRCNDCGLINTMNNSSTKTESLGKSVKYHNEGGYYKDITTTGKAMEQGSLTPEIFDVTMTTRQYIPKTTVRDGEFEKTRSTTKYKCCVCGNIMTSVFESERKIGD